MNDKAELTTDVCYEKKSYTQPRVVKLGDATDTKNAFNVNTDATFLANS